MVVTLIAPEVTCSVALRQWEESRSTVKEMKGYGIEWTTTQSFYAAMGGYVLRYDNKEVPLLTSEIISLLKHNSEERNSEQEELKERPPPFQLPILEERDIKDRSKASGFTKFFTIVQTGWLVAQCIVRGVQHLPISELEIATVAFATCTVVASGLWWNKPLDVEMTTPITYDGPLPDSINTNSKGWRDREARKRVKMTTRIVARGSKRSMFFNLVLPLFLFSTIFGIIHLSAWHFNFPTSKELLMWRSCALIAALMPLAIAGSLQVASIWDPSAHGDKHVPITAPEFAAAVIVFYFLSVAAYVAARLILIFQVFYCLRSMPAGIYTSVAWVNYIPHL
jgi:hypothetical protein